MPRRTRSICTLGDLCSAGVRPCTGVRPGLGRSSPLDLAARTSQLLAIIGFYANLVNYCLHFVGMEMQFSVQFILDVGELICAIS